jgi:Ca-activated chloride channel homolog
VLLSVAESVPPLTLAVAILLIAGPQRYGTPEDKRKLTNIQFCVDVSGSMTDTFGDGNRYDGAMAAVTKFVDHRKGDAFGLTFFGNNYIHWCPLTADPSAIKCSLPFMKPEVAPYWFGGTEIAKALNGVKQVLIERTEGDRMVILITDGFDYSLDEAQTDLIRQFKQHNITVCSIVVGYHTLQDAIVNISRSTGGDAFLADDPEALKFVFHKIDQLKQARVEKSIAEPMDDYRPYCVAGMVLVALASVFQYGLRYTPW